MELRHFHDKPFSFPRALGTPDLPIWRALPQASFSPISPLGRERFKGKACVSFSVSSHPSPAVHQHLPSTDHSKVHTRHTHGCDCASPLGPSMWSIR